MRRVRLACVAGMMLAAMQSWGAPAPEMWSQLDIVPMPKEIELTGRELPMADAVLMLGTEPSRQDQIGAQWIADEVARLGGEAPQVLKVGETTAAPVRIIIGTRQSNPAIEAAAHDGLLDVGPGNPGERGYVILSRPAGQATEVLLAGADEIGALYACVTLGELLAARDGQVLYREARVRDWPDYINVLLGGARIGSMAMPELKDLFSAARGLPAPNEQVREQYLAGMRWAHDWMLRRKVSSFWYYMSLAGYSNVTPAGRALIAEGIEYGKERGIGALVYAMAPFAGKTADHPELADNRPCLGPGRYPEWIRCWSLDDMRRETAEGFATFCGELGLTDVGFHDTDTGGFLSPAEWNDRCDVCKQRWGDDYAAATANKFQIYYDALKQLAPDSHMNITIYPYNINIFTQEGAEQYIASRYGAGPGVPDAGRQLREKWAEFWRRITAMLPDDIIFCIRETTRENVDAYRELIGQRGIFIWYGEFNRPWHSLYSNTPSMVGTFFRDKRDYMFPMAEQTFIPAMGMATREYAWDVNAPGAETWSRFPDGEQWRHTEPEGDAFAVVLPHVARNLFGRRFGDELTKALALNVCSREIFADRPELIKTAERMQWQADNAAEGMRIMDGIWAQRQGEGDMLGWDEWTFRRVVFLREHFHCAHFMAAARAQNLLARELARQGKATEAEQAVAAGKDLVEQGLADEQMLLTDRPDDPIYECASGNNWSRLFREFTPGVNMDYAMAGRELEQTEKELPTLAAAAGVPEDVLKQLDVNRRVQVSKVQQPITVDGLLDEPAWRDCYPADSFFVYEEGRKVANAHTRVRLLCDDERLYLGATCWVPDGGQPVAQHRERDGEILQDDALEIFLVPPGMGGSYAHFMINAMGCWRDTRLDKVTGGEGLMRYDRHPEWDPESLVLRAVARPGRWDVEMSITLADLGGPGTEGWRANFAREFLSAQGTRELSSILPTDAADFHDLPKFRPVVFSPADFRAPGPDVQVEFSQPDVKVRTLPDRIATVCSFGATVNCSRALHEATLSAELYDDTGKLHLRQELARQQAILYTWEAPEPFEVAFESPVQRGGVRLVLETDDGVFERWLRLGGWEGAPEVGGAVHEGALVGSCALASKVTLPGADTPVDLLNGPQGTIELRFLPDWPGQTFGLYKQFDVNPLSHVLLHFGPVRPEYVYTVNFSSLLIDLYAASTLRLASYLPEYAGWSVQANLDGLDGWEAPRCHHLAVVWDGDAPVTDGLRIYVDGKRVSGETVLSKPERIENPDSVRVHTAEPYAIELGSIVDGRRPSGAAIDDLRISRVARYTADFTPPQGTPALDADTSALLLFDGDLTGAGRAPDGSEYALQAVAGAVEYH
ncbi:MAG TPA: hypothetical protein VM283_03965 [Armatimonadota bacterium]|nr:hypothetical protein [Armatimonadota bacterium]